MIRKRHLAAICLGGSPLFGHVGKDAKKGLRCRCRPSSRSQRGQFHPHIDKTEAAAMMAGK